MNLKVLMIMVASMGLIMFGVMMIFPEWSVPVKIGISCFTGAVLRALVAGRLGFFR